MSANAGEWLKALDQAGGAFDRFAKKLGISAGVGATAGTFLANTFIQALDAIGHSITKAIDSAEELGKLSQKTGIAVDELSGLAFAAKITDTQLSDLAVGIKKLSINLQEMASGDTTSGATRAFAALGVAATDGAGKIRPVNDVLLQLADKFSQLEDGAGKTALAVAIFGKAGDQLIPFLNEGAKGIEALKQRAAELGIVFGKDTSDAAQKFNDDLKLMGAVWDGLVVKLASSFLPLMDRLSGAFVDLSRNIKLSLPTAKEVELAFTRIEEFAINAMTAIENFGTKVGAVFQAVMQRFSLNFTAADKTIADALRKVAENNRDAAQQIADLYTDLDKNVEKTGKEIPKHAAPIMASVKAITDEQKEFNKSVQEGLSFAQKLDTPYQTLTKTLENLSNAYTAGKITAEQMGIAQQAAAYAALSAYGSVFSSLTGGLAQLFSKNKAIAIANATVNTFEAVTKALSAYPPPLSYIAAAGALAAGLAQVANIRKTTSSGGGGGAGSGSAGGGGAAPQAPTQAPRQVIVEGINPSSLYSGEAVRGLVKELKDFQRDGGEVVIR